MAADCSTLWIGDALGPVERACLRSVLNQGHQLTLYCYRKPEGIPHGVQIRDAHDILPASEIFFHRNGSIAAFADWFRLELQRRGLGTWVDTDVYLLSPLDAERPYLFGEEEQPSGINNAVLRLPADAPLLAALLDIFKTRRIPSWFPPRIYWRARLREMIGGRVDFTDLPLGSTGPFALTAAARRFGVAGEALPVDVFNPVAWDKAGWIRDPAIRLESVITKRTVAVHLWNECIKRFKNAPAAEGSFLSRLHHEGRE